MTEPSPPPDDQLVSDHLDGAAEIPGAFPGDDAGRARLARFAEVRDLLATDVPVPPASREAALSAALGVFDAEVRVAAVADDAGDELAARRRRHWRAAPLIGAAASVLLLLGVLAGLRYGQGSAQDSGAALRAADSPASAPSPASPASAGGAPAESESPVAGDQERRAVPPVTAGALPSNLGPAEDPASFRRAIATVLPRVLLTTTSSASATADQAGADAATAPACEATLRGDHPELGAVVLRSAAQRDGATLPVVAFLVPAPPPAPPQTPAVRAFLVDPASCRAIFDETI